MLYLVATPIGNLADLTFRAVEVLKTCDYILCEDTRHSRHLLSHYSITTPVKSFFRFNEASQEETIIEDLLANKAIALISDAGTPCIADPGQRLVRRCHNLSIEVTPIPGPCAAIAALCCSGLDTSCFQFVGFLPKKTPERRRALIDYLLYQGTTICYESPHRLLSTLSLLNTHAPERQICIGREITKKFEEFQRGTAAKLQALWATQSVKGEIVLLISASPSPLSEKWHTLSAEEHIQLMEKTYRLDRKEAIKLVAQLRGISKKELYS